MRSSWLVLSTGIDANYRQDCSACAGISLLDEPIATLDIGRQLELMALMTDLNRDGHTILAALHDLRPALDFFPRAILLSNGRLTAEGPTEAVVLGAALESAFGVQVQTGAGFRF